MLKCNFFVEGTPRPQPRPRAFSRGGFTRVYDPATAEGWKSQVAIAARPFVPVARILGPVRVDIHWSFPRPQSHFRTGKHAGELKPNAPRWHTQGRGKNGGDRDNLDKAILDALTELRFWKDDGQACAGELTKKYVVGDELPGAMIRIEELSNAILREMDE